MDLMKLSIPFVTVILSFSSADCTSPSKKVVVVASFQISMIAFMTSCSLSVVNFCMVKRKSGRMVITGETWKVIAFEDQTGLLRRVWTSSCVRLWIRKVIGCLPWSPFSLIGVATVASDEPVISQAALIRSIAMSWWFGW